MAGKRTSEHALPLMIAAVGTAGLRIVALAFPDARLWGIDMLRYFDPPLIAVFTLLPLLAALPAWRSGLRRLLEKRSAALWNRLSLIAGILLLIVVALFPMRTFFYGDGGALIAEIYKIGSREQYTSSLLLNLQSAPLAGALLHTLAAGLPTVMHAIGMTLPETAQYPFVVLSVVGAAAFILILTIEKDRTGRLPLLLLISGTGGVLFFFGYVEMYLPVFLSVTAFLLAALTAAHDERPPWMPVALYALSVAAHFMAIALLPVLLFLLLRRQSFMRSLTGSKRALSGSAAIAAVLAAVLYFLLGLHHSDSRIVMPAEPVVTDAGTLSYTLLSSWHLADLVNLVALLALFPVLYLLGIAIVRRKALRTDDGVRLLLIALFSFGLFLFFANTSLGLARDWDIGAPLGVIIVLLVYALRLKESDADRMARLLQAGVTAVLFMLPWIAVNVNEDASAARFADIMALDDTHMYGDYALSGYEALRKHALHTEDYETEAALLRRMIEIVGYPEQYRLMMNNAQLYARERPEEFQRQVAWMLDHLAEQARALHERNEERGYAIGLHQIDSLAVAMAADAVHAGSTGALYRHMEEFAVRSGCATGRDLLAGALLYERSDMAGAAERFAAVWEAGFRDPRADGLYGAALFLSGREAVADSVFAAGLRRWSDDPQYLFIVASTYLQSPSRHAEARQLLERALRCDPPPAARARIEHLRGQF